MSIRVIKKLDDLKRIHKNLVRIDKPLYKVSQFVIGEIIDNWQEAKGGNGKAMKELTAGYRNIKKTKYGRQKRDLLLSGDLYRSFIVKVISRFKMALTFTRDAMGKAVGNYNIDNNMMQVSKKLVKEVNKKLYKLIWRK